MIVYKIIRKFIDQKIGPTEGQYGPTVDTEAKASDLLRKIEKSHPGFQFEVQRGD